MFNKYYQDELTFLRELGAEFAQAHPKIANLLSDRSADPDVERLNEAFAFIAGQIRQKIDDELPELTHSLIELLWPHYLRPIPSMTIVEFTPKPEVRGVQRIEKGVELNTAPIEGTVCKFRTCVDVDLLPIMIDEAEIESSISAPESLRLRFRMLNNAQLSGLKQLSSIRLHLHGDAYITYELYLRLMTSVESIHIQTLRGGRPKDRFTLRPDALKPFGTDPDSGMLPYPKNSFSGYRLLQEYFALPSRFLFVELTGLDRLQTFENHDEAFEVIFEFKRGTETSGLTITPGNILLHCTPAVNLFAHPADPILTEHHHTEYRVRPTCEKVEHYEIYSIDEVVGITRGTAKRVDYNPFYDFSHHRDEAVIGRGYYQSRMNQSERPREDDEEIEVYRVSNLRENPVGYGTDRYLSFVAIDGEVAVPSVETVSIELTCSNRHLPEQINVNDINIPGPTAPEFATFRNITKPTSSVSPPLDGGLHWRLISHLSLNFLSLIDVDALRGLIELYNFQAYYDQQAARENEQRLKGIRSISCKPSEWFHRGAPIRGRLIHMDLDEECFAGEGDMYMFAGILSEFFSLYASMNSFTRLKVRGKRRGETYEWPRKLGQQIIL